MKRSALFVLIAALLVGALFRFGSPADAQDADPEATIAALETQVAEQRATSQARGSRINDQKTQIAELRDQVAELGGTVSHASPTAGEPIRLTYFGDATTLTDGAHLPAGRYRVEATVGNYSAVAVFTVAVYGPGGFEDSLFVEDFDARATWEGSVVLSAPVDGEYFFQIVCGHPWTLTITPL